jgi:hypothetical protein
MGATVLTLPPSTALSYQPVQLTEPRLGSHLGSPFGKPMAEFPSCVRLIRERRKRYFFRGWSAADVAMAVWLTVPATWVGRAAINVIRALKKAHAGGVR